MRERRACSLKKRSQVVSLKSVLRKFKRALWLLAMHSGLASLYRRFVHRRTLTVLIFHRVLPADSEAYRHSEQEYVLTPQEFESCLNFLKTDYTVVTLADVEAATRGTRALPAHAALITFDDGWHDNLSVAEPILRRHGLRATLFANVDAMRQTDARWWQDALVEVMLHRPEKLKELCPNGEFYAAARSLLALPLEARLGRLAPWLTYQPAERQMLTSAGLRQLDPAVWDVGSHGTTHVPFTFATDLRAECAGSAEALSQWLGQPVRTLAFPHGRYSPEILEQVQASGYSLVFTSEVCLNPTEEKPPATLGRIHVSSRACASRAALAALLWRPRVHALP